MTLNRTAAPPFHLSEDYSLTPPEIFQLPGEIKLFAFRDLQQEAVKLEFVFSAGRWFEPKNGVSHFTSQLLSKGTQLRNSFALAEALDSLGAHLEISAGFDVVEISLFSLRKNLLNALQVVLEMLSVPSFDEDELRLMKEIFIQNLRVSNEKSNVVASKEIRKAIFGGAHPYGNSVEESDVSAISQQDLFLFFKNNFSLHSVFLVGCLSDKEIKEVIQHITFPSTPFVQTPHSESLPGKSLTISKPDSVQTSIRLGKKCIHKGETTDYFDAVMFNHVFGGFFGSRLMKNIREEKGLTYGIYSGMNHFINDSFWVIGAEVNQKNTIRAVEEIKKELKALQEVPLPAGELDAAKNYFIGSWQSENATLFAVAEKWKGIHLWNLSENYYSKLLSHVRDISCTQIQEAANNFSSGSDLLEIQVG